MTSQAYKQGFDRIDWTGHEPRQRWRHTVPGVRKQALPSPMLIRDDLDSEVQSFADGKFYSSKSAIRRTYRADGNPQGVEYVEVGNDYNAPIHTPPKRDPNEVKHAVDRAMARYHAGERPKEVGPSAA